MQKELQTKISQYLKNSMKMRHHYQILTVIAIAVIFLVYSVLTKPAISMAYDNISVEAMRENTAFGQVVPVRITAQALQGTEPTTFVIYTKGVGGGLSFEYQFNEENICEVMTEDGTTIQLHKEEILDEENSNVIKHNYWFTLQPEEKTAFVLNYTSDVEVITNESNVSTDGGSQVQPEQTSENIESSKEDTGSTDVTEEEKTEATTEKATEEEKAEATTEKIPEEEKAEATTEKVPEEEQVEATTEKIPEEEQVEATTEKVIEEEKTEVATEKVIEEEQVENITDKSENVKQEVTAEKKDVTIVDPTTFNKIAMTEAAYIMAENDIEHTESEVTEQVSTESQEVTTEENSHTTPEEIPKADQNLTGPEVLPEETTEVTVPIHDEEEIQQEMPKMDQYLEIYVAASADGGYGEIAQQLQGEVEGWKGNVPVERIENKKVANLSWTAEENVSDIIVKARTKEDTLVTISGSKSNFNETDLKDIRIKAEESSNMDMETLKSMLESDELSILEQKGFQIVFLTNGQEVQPTGDFNITFEEFEYDKDTKTVEVYQTNEEGAWKKIDSNFSEDGSLRILVNGTSYKQNEIVFLGNKTPTKISKNGLTAIHITKEWKDEKEPEDITEIGIHIYNDEGKEVATTTLTKQASWKATVKDLPLYNANGERIQYSVVEDEIQGYPSGMAQYSGQEKVWVPVKEEEITEDSEYLTIIKENDKQYVYSSKDPSNKVEVTKEQLGEQVVKDINGIETSCFIIQEEEIAKRLGIETGIEEDLEVTIEDVDEIEAAIKEEEELTISTYKPLSLKTSIEEEETNINTYIGSYKEEYTDSVVVLTSGNSDNGSTTVTVTKEWLDGEEHPDSVTVQLYRRYKGENSWKEEHKVSGYTLVLSEANHWTSQWDNLPSRDRTKQYEYTAREVEIPDGYEAITATNQEDNWEAVTTLENNQTYLILSSNGYTFNSSLDVVNINSTGSEKANNIQNQWIVETSNDGIYLKNVYNDKYIAWTSNDDDSWKLVENRSNAEKFQYYNNKLYIKGYGWKKYYIQLNGNHMYATSKSNYATEFTFYKMSNMTQVLIQNKKFTNQIDNTDGIFPHTKKIDYLGDGGNDSKEYTEVTDSDAYRLYLDLASNALPEPVDVVLVIDQSNSMKEEWSNNVTKARKVNQEAKKLVNKILTNSGDNRISVIGYAEAAKTQITWSSNLNNVEAAINRATTPKYEGTNMMDALRETKYLLNNNTTSRKKYVFFLTDGAPTFYYSTTNSEENEWSQGNYFDEGYEPDKKGNGTENSLASSKEPTIAYAKKAREELKNVTFYALGVDIGGDSTYADPVLDAIASSSDLHLTAEKGNSEQLTEAFETLLRGLEANQLSITDTLSAYVDLNQTADIVVTMQERTDISGNCQDDNQEAIMLWKGSWNGQRIIAEEVDTNEVSRHMKYSHDDRNNIGTSIMKEITYNPDTKQIKAIFNPYYKINGDYLYTLSFNIVVTEEAKEEFSDQEYPMIGDNEMMKGDLETDYGQNTTSSNQIGLFANKFNESTYQQEEGNVNISYRVVGKKEVTTEVYQERPVVQVPEKDAYNLVLTKVDVTNTNMTLEGVQFDLYREDETSNSTIEIDGKEVKVVKLNTNSLVTDENGQIDLTTIIGNSKLIDGTYYLVETKAYIGYKISGPYSFVLSSGNVMIDSSNTMLVSTKEGESYKLTVKNTKTASLPETGGMGTTTFTVIGITTMAVAAIGIIYTRKQQEHRGER